MQPIFNVYFMPDTPLDTGDALVNGLDKIPTIMETHNPLGKNRMR